jgi:beta-lactam-binding protein with PASTA domain
MITALQARRIGKILFILLIAGIILFVIFDDVVMPAYVQQGKTTRVPNVVGMPLEHAKAAITQAGLQPKEAEYKQDKQYPEGTIALQNPLPGSEVKFGRGVYLTISGGEALVMVPNLRGKSVRDATFALERYGLKLGQIEYAPSDSAFENTVVAQEIQADSRVRSGSAINVIVSQGKTADRIAVPAVMLKTLGEAEKILNGAGFNVGKVTYQVSLDLLPNTVIEQYPRPGELAPRAARIDLIIAQKADKKSPFEN